MIDFYALSHEHWRRILNIMVSGFCDLCLLNASTTRQVYTIDRAADAHDCPSLKQQMAWHASLEYKDEKQADVDEDWALWFSLTLVMCSGVVSVLYV